MSWANDFKKTKGILKNTKEKNLDRHKFKFLRSITDIFASAPVDTHIDLYMHDMYVKFVIFGIYGINKSFRIWHLALKKICQYG